MSAREMLSLDGGELQMLLGAVTRAYAARLEAGEELAPFQGDGPTATEVVVTVSAMLDQAGVEPFELGLWRAWGMAGPAGGKA